MVDPTPSQLRVYDAVLEAHAALVDKLRPGAVISQVVAAVSDQVRRHVCRGVVCARGSRRVGSAMLAVLLAVPWSAIAPVGVTR